MLPLVSLLFGRRHPHLQEEKRRVFGALFSSSISMAAPFLSPHFTRRGRSGHATTLPICFYQFLTLYLENTSMFRRSISFTAFGMMALWLCATLLSGWLAPQAALAQEAQASRFNPNRPVLAFYYSWYNPSDWNAAHMSDLPEQKYRSGDQATIDHQLSQAAGAGITGFISSWWGRGTPTDKHFGVLLKQSVPLEQKQHVHFASSLYIETDTSAFSSFSKMVDNLRYVRDHYTKDAHFFHWQGKPVLFFWDPLGQGRTLNEWRSLRQKVDPNHQMLWSAETVDTTLLDVFDGIHLFSAGYWGILHHTMPAVDQGFRAKVDAYNRAHHTHKIWAAGVLPGYDDTRVPGRTNSYVVPRNHGQTYAQSWQAAISSKPDWVTITSYNEWFEGAQIEPSVHYHHFYLDLTHKFATQWHG